MSEENVEKLLNELFSKNYKPIQPTFSSLTKPGDNFLSTILKVDVRLKKNDDGEEETLHAVAKCVLSSNDFVKQVYPNAFRNEILFYKVMLPTLQNFQKERGVEDVLDMFPKFYGAKLNEHGEDDEIDENAVILLENLKKAGYTNIDRHQGFNIDGAKLILKDLAQFHATGLALKFSQTDVFDEKIRKNCRKAIPPPPPPDKNHYQESIDVFFSILEDYEYCKEYLPSLKEKFSKMREKINEFFDIPAREPFATLVHCDVWVNNTMQLVENGQLLKNKFVDWQLVFYQSPASDVLFFLWTSVQLKVLKDNFENLLLIYHKEFIDHLRKLNGNTNLFTLEKFWDEVDTAARTNFMDIMFMTMFVVFGKTNGDATDDETKVLKEDVPVAAGEKIAYMVTEYGRRGWIQ